MSQSGRGSDILEGASSVATQLGTGSSKVWVTGAACTQPVPGKNQDRFVLKPLSSTSLVAGIFDGHSIHSNQSGQQHAEQAARHLSGDLWKRTQKALEDETISLQDNEKLVSLVGASFQKHQNLCEARYKRDVADTLMAKKEELEKELGDEVPMELPQEGGTTATVALLHKRGLLVAWVGDSRALLGVQGDGEGAGLQAVPLTRDHNLDDEAERLRLLKAGGKSGRELLHNHVSVPGVEGSLKVTRSLGDSPFHKGDAVSSTPGVRQSTRCHQCRSQRAQKRGRTSRRLSARARARAFLSSVRVRCCRAT